MSNAPIDPHPFSAGVTVVQIEDLRIARGLTRRPASSCRHRHMTYDERERRVWCRDCEAEVEPFDAFVYLVEVWESGSAKLARREAAIAEAEGHALRSRAAKVMDDAWRSRTTAPLCPHCREVLLPDDVARGVASASRELAVRRRAACKDKGGA